MNIKQHLRKKLHPQLMKINTIVAVNNLGFIGKDNQLMWHSSEDLKHFKNMTKDSVVIMGRKTFESLNKKPLPNRINLVVGSDYLSLNDALDEARKHDKPIWVIGGASIYQQTNHLCSEVHVSVINDNQEGDTKFSLDGYIGDIYYYYFEPNK